MNRIFFALNIDHVAWTCDNHMRFRKSIKNVELKEWRRIYKAALHTKGHFDSWTHSKMSFVPKIQLFGSALNFFLLYALVSSYSLNRINPDGLDELDDDAKAKLNQVVDEFNSGNKQEAKELLDNSDLSPEIKKVVDAAIETNPAEEKQIPTEADGDQVKVDDVEAEGKNDVDENKPDINAMPLTAEDGNWWKGINKDGSFPYVAKFANMEKEESEDDLNTQEAQNNFNAILNTVRSATADLEEAVKQGKVDMEKALQLTDLENLVSSFQNPLFDH